MNIVIVNEADECSILADDITLDTDAELSDRETYWSAIQEETATCRTASMRLRYSAATLVLVEIRQEWARRQRV